MSLLELENVVTAYGKVAALKGLTLRVEQGEIVALLGSAWRQPQMVFGSTV